MLAKTDAKKKFLLHFYWLLSIFKYFIKQFIWINVFFFCLPKFDTFFSSSILLLVITRQLCNFQRRSKILFDTYFLLKYSLIRQKRNIHWERTESKMLKIIHIFIISIALIQLIPTLSLLIFKSLVTIHFDLSEEYINFQGEKIKRKSSDNFQSSFLLYFL